MSRLSPKDIVDGFMTELADQTSDPTKSGSNYYFYGHKSFHVNVGHPPQVRWQPLSFRFSKPSARGSADSQADIANIEQDYEVFVWGENETQALLEFQALIKAIKAKKKTQFSSTMWELQPDPMTVEGEWIEASDVVSRGSVIRFNYTTKAQMPQKPYITSSIDTISSSIDTVVNNVTSSFSFELTGSN